MNCEKVEKDGKIAILYSPGYDAGWYTWNSEDKVQMVFSPEIIELVENNRFDEITQELCDVLFGFGVYIGGKDNLVVEWVPKGCTFYIKEYDGHESIHRDHFITA
jgi:hypothetical protein